LAPGVTLAVLMTAPTTVVTPQPIWHITPKGASGRTWATAICGKTVTFEGVEHPMEGSIICACR
jgi:hypothetical protein